MSKKSSVKRALVAESPAMLQLLEDLERFAETDAPVLIEGEPGSGRGLIARALHLRSKRGGELMAMDAGSANQELLRSKVEETSQNLMAKAGGGTLLIRDICELRKRGQRNLHKALNDGSFLQVRVVATADPDLEDAVEAKVFFQALYEQLAQHRLLVPPLREREEDIVPLMSRFVAALGRDMGRERLAISCRANDALLRYPWPGNVAEMKQVARRLVVRAQAGKIEASDVDAVLPTLAQRVPANEVCFDELVRHKIDELLCKVDGYPLSSLHEEVMGLVERPLLEAVMEHTGHNQLKASEVLGISRNTLRRKLTEMGALVVKKTSQHVSVLRKRSNARAARRVRK